MFNNLPLEIYIDIFKHFDIEDNASDDLRTLVSLRFLGGRVHDAVCYVISRRNDNGLELQLCGPLNMILQRMQDFQSSRNDPWKDCFRTVAFGGRFIQHMNFKNAKDEVVDDAARKFLTSAAAFLGTEAGRFSTVYIAVFASKKEYTSGSVQRYSAFIGAMAMLFLYSTAKNALPVRWRIAVSTWYKRKLERVVSAFEFTVRGFCSDDKWDWTQSFTEVVPSILQRSPYRGRQVPVFWDTLQTKTELPSDAAIMGIHGNLYSKAIKSKQVLENFSFVFLRCIDNATRSPEPKSLYEQLGKNLGGKFGNLSLVDGRDSVGIEAVADQRREY